MTYYIITKFRYKRPKFVPEGDLGINFNSYKDAESYASQHKLLMRSKVLPSVLKDNLILYHIEERNIR